MRRDSARGKVGIFPVEDDLLTRQQQAVVKAHPGCVRDRDRDAFVRGTEEHNGPRTVGAFATIEQVGVSGNSCELLFVKPSLATGVMLFVLNLDSQNRVYDASLDAGLSTVFPPVEAADQQVVPAFRRKRNRLVLKTTN